MLFCKDQLFCQKFLPFLIIFITIASYIGFEISAPSLVSIGKFFNSSEKIVGFTITANFIGILLMSFFYGPISDHFGRRKILIFGLCIAVLGGILTVSAQSIEMIIFGRFIEGLGIAAPLTLISAIISEVYKENSARVFRMNLGFLTVFTALGPVVGGFVNNFIGFRGNYLIVLILQVISLFLVCLFFQESLIKEIDHDTKINFKKVIKKITTVVRTPKFLSCLIIPVILYASFIGFVNYAAFLYVETFNLTDIKYSLHQGLMIGFFAITNLLLSFIKYDHKFWEKKMIYISSFLICISYILILFTKGAYGLTILMIIAFIGHAILSPIFFAKLYDFSKDKGTTSSVVGIIRSMFIVFFTWVCTYFYNGSVLNIGIILCLSFAVILLSIIHLFRSKLFDNAI